MLCRVLNVFIHSLWLIINSHANSPPHRLFHNASQLANKNVSQLVNKNNALQLVNKRSEGSIYYHVILFLCQQTMFECKYITGVELRWITIEIWVGNFTLRKKTHLLLTWRLCSW